MDDEIFLIPYTRQFTDYIRLEISINLTRVMKNIPSIFWVMRNNRINSIYYQNYDAKIND